MSQQPSSPSNQQSSDSNSSKVTEAECNVLDSAFERHHGNFKICILCLMEKKLCKLFRPNRPSQLLHFQNQHGIKREDLCSVLHQLICRFTQPITVSEKRQKGAWMRALIKQTVLKSTPFRHVNSPYFAEISRFKTSATQLVREMHKYAKLIKRHQFWQYNRKKIYASMILDGVTTGGGEHLYAFILKTRNHLHFLGTAQNETAMTAEWLASIVKEKIEWLKTTYNIEVISVAQDNAAVMGLMVKYLNGEMRNAPFEVVQKTMLANNKKVLKLPCLAQYPMLMFALLHRSLQYQRLGRCYSQSQQDQGVILRNKMDVHEQSTDITYISTFLLQTIFQEILYLQQQHDSLNSNNPTIHLNAIYKYILVIYIYRSNYVSLQCQQSKWLLFSSIITLHINVQKQ
ncbi:Conserved_hypothetical protein [Hexamita inflata]|uniref:DUF659 domain-containing protein n=1 Tax=Hexamita inflata TaxID=28002 RepID=A0AA86Q0E3_9EUKA|nr:Conserved hypothetical protein [Hexamita inflata]